MTSNKILSLYQEISLLKAVDLSKLIEERLDLLLNNYEEDLQKSYKNISGYDAFVVVKEMSKNAKFM